MTRPRNFIGIEDPQPKYISSFDLCGRGSSRSRYMCCRVLVFGTCGDIERHFLISRPVDYLIKSKEACYLLAEIQQTKKGKHKAFSGSPTEIPDTTCNRREKAKSNRDRLLLRCNYLENLLMMTNRTTRNLYLTTAIVVLFQWSISNAASAPAKTTSQVIYKPTKEDLAHGKTQTERMLHDLPAMRQWLTKDNPLYDFAVQHYAADAQGRRIYWVPFKEDGWKTIGCNAISVVATPNRTGSICIRKVDFQTGAPISANKAWACFVFEALNTQNGYRYTKIISDARTGVLSREQFILRAAEDEFRNVIEQKRFYKQIVEPWARRNRIKTNGVEWHSKSPKTFEEEIRLRYDRNAYPWDFFGDYYDNYILNKEKQGKP